MKKLAVREIYCPKCGKRLFETILTQGAARCPCGGVIDLAEVAVRHRGGGKLH